MRAQIRALSPAFVSASKLCEPVIAALLAALLFAEIPAPVQILGGVMILGGVLYYSRIESAASATPTEKGSPDETAH